MRLAKILLLSLLAVSAVFAVDGRTLPKRPFNSARVVVDTIYLAGTATAYSQAFWIEEGANHVFLFELQDTSAAGMGSDSVAASIEVLQAFDICDSTLVLRNSRAHPDSTTSALVGSTAFMLSDSLDVAMTDTVAAWIRHRVPDTRFGGRDTVGWYYNDDIDSTYKSTSKAKLGGYRYYCIKPDFSPAIVFKLVGKARNDKTGSRWVIRVFQQRGTPVRITQ